MIIDSPIISGSYAATGSLNQVGNVVITGSLTVTEQITGSINSASFAQSAATASYLSNYIPPFPYTGSAGISGSLSVNGDITSSGAIVAQTLYVQTITSSVDFVTGSTRFGSELSNTHLFTGSVTITGSLAVNGSTAVLTNQTGAMSVATASYVLNAVSASFAQTAISASYASNVPATASFAVSASQAENATSASWVTGSSVIGVVASATSASYALTASYASNVPSTASFAISASQAQNAVSSSYALTSSYSLSGGGFPYSGSAVITGSLLITNLGGGNVKYLVTDNNGNITSQDTTASIKQTQTFTASAGQTTFTITNGYTTGLVDVFVNGTKLNSSEFIDTNGTTIVLATGSFVDDIVEFNKYLPAAGVTNNSLRQLTTFTASAGQTVFSASYTPGLLDIYYNGSHLSNGDFTANNGTFITLATGSAEGDILDVFVYTYQVGAFSGIGGQGAANQIAYFNTTNSITSSAAITISGSNAIVTGSLLGTASNSNLLNGSGSGEFVPTGSFNAFSSSILSYTGSANSRFSALETTSGSNITRIAALEVTSGSNITRISALESASGSAITRLSSLESKTGSYATTGSNTFVEGQYLSSSYNPTGFSTTASLYTDGGLRVTKDAYISGTLYLNNVTVYGTQSVCYITSSQLNISSNLISVNTATPSVRFGGLAVYDSGSTGLTGSILWDSEANHWVYSNPSGSGYSGGMFISGPRASSLGSETGTTACMLLAGQGGDHLTSSMIYHDSTVTCIPNTLIGSTAYFSGRVCASNISAGTSTICGNLLISETTGTTLGLYNNGSLRVCLGMTGNEGEISAYRSDGSKNVYLSSYYDSYITGPGKFGLNCTTPYYLLDVNGTARVMNGIYFNNSGGSFLWEQGNNCLRFGTNDTERFKISGDGVVCFACQVCTNGTTIRGGNDLRLYRSQNDYYWRINPDSSNFLQIGPYCSNGTPYSSCNTLTFRDDGKLGIGTQNPVNVLDVYKCNNTNVNMSITNLYINQGNLIQFCQNTSGGNVLAYMGHAGDSTGDFVLFNGSTGTPRYSISCLGITSFACQVCAPQYITTQGSSVSYAVGTDYTIWNSEAESCIQDNNNPAAYTRIKTWIADRSGCATIRFTGYIVSGPTYWGYRVTRNGTSSYMCVSYAQCGQPGCASPYVHSYSSYQFNVGPFLPGDCIGLDVVSTGGGATPAPGQGQYILAKEFRVFSSTPNFAAGTAGNVFGEWVGIGTCTPFSNLYVNGNNPAAYDASVDNGQDGCGVTLTIRNNSTTTNSFAQLNMQVSGDSGRAVGRIALIRTASATGDMAFITENGNTKTEKMRITSAGQVQIGCGVNSMFYNGAGCRYNFTALNTPQDLVGICANNGILVIRDHTAGGTGAFLIDPNQGVICMASNIPATVSIAWSGSVWRWCLTTGGVPRCLGYGFYGA